MGRAREQACQRALTQKQTFWAADALEQGERRRGGQQLAQHDRSRLANALVLQVELRDAVLAQVDERDPAEVGHNGVLQHHLGQSFCGITQNMIGADATSHGEGMSKAQEGICGVSRQESERGQEDWCHWAPTEK